MAHIDVSAQAATPQTVPVNAYESEDAFVVVAPLPGVMADDIEVDVRDGRLRIAAAMRTPADKAYVIHEWHYGPYERVVALPDGFGASVTASFGNGQLAVSVGRGDPAGPITVRPAGA